MFTVIDNYKWPNFKLMFKLEHDIEMAILHGSSKYLYSGDKGDNFPNTDDVMSYLNDFTNGKTYPYL